MDKLKLSNRARAIVRSKTFDYLAQKYLGRDKYPFRQPGEARVTIVIEPQQITGV